MLYNMNELIANIHANSKAHGWWETDRPFYETIALIHSEWSEALEEYRAGRPNVWYGETEINGAKVAKPEGIAVELIDGVIRILDLFGRRETDFDGFAVLGDTVLSLNEQEEADICKATLPEFIGILHVMTSSACLHEDTDAGMMDLLRAVGAVTVYVQNVLHVDPLETLNNKHDFNKLRPYKHGKVC